MPRGENRPSILLSREENDQVFSLIGPKCQSLATAVVQLFTTEDPSHSKWKKKDTGVLCLIKDNGKRSYFFRIYCLYRKTMIWEQEVYLQIEYKNPRPYLHTFEAEEYMAAFNFANENEAKILMNILLEKIALRKNRREERRQKSLQATRANSSGPVRPNGALPLPPPPVPAAPPVPAPPAPAPPPHIPKSNLVGIPSSGTLPFRSGKKRKGRILTKADIGMPENFKHVSHIGWDASKGFDLGQAPESDEMRSFFTKAGISETQLEDQETREFIYDFIEKYGGLDAVKEELHNVKSAARVIPAAPAGAPPAPPVPSRSPAPPPLQPQPPAPRTYNAHYAPSYASRAPPPPPPSRAVPPPPAPSHRSAPPRPLPPSTSGPPSVPPPPPPGTAPPPPPAAAPPPPPPPPPAPPAPPAAPPAPPAPASHNDAPAPMDPRAALMESIRSGAKGLKRVDPATKPAASEDSRSNLLSEIRQGIELKSVARAEGGAGAGRAGGGAGRAGGGAGAARPACGLAEALSRALEERNRAIHSDTDSDDDGDATTSDGEWDD